MTVALSDEVEALDVAKGMLAHRDAERAKLNLIHQYYAGKKTDIYVPRSAKA